MLLYHHHGRRNIPTTVKTNTRSGMHVLSSILFGMMIMTFSNGMIPVAHAASLLEQFGTDPDSKDFNTKVVVVTKTSTKSMVSTADSVQIDPTLRGCK
jgi:hypothetical protein